MKLAAIAKRGVRRDYWDLYEILTRTRLKWDSVRDWFERHAARELLRRAGANQARGR